MIVTYSSYLLSNEYINFSQYSYQEAPEAQEAFSSTLLQEPLLCAGGFAIPYLFMHEGSLSVITSVLQVY